MDWSDVEAVIPAVMSMPERADSVKELLIELGKQCPGIKARVIPQYRHDDKPPHWRDVFETISKGLVNLHGGWVLYFEDDAMLAPWFGEDLLPVLENAKDDVGLIALFSQERSDLSLFNDGVRLREVPEDVCWAYSQAVAIRREVAEYWGAHMVQWWDDAKESWKRAPDVCLGLCCRKLGKKILIKIPNTAQHRRGPSAFNNPYFPWSETFGLRRSQ
jgi:hypothetical protein